MLDRLDLLLDPILLEAAFRDEDYLPLFNKSNVRVGPKLTLKDLPPEQKLPIIQTVRAAINPQFRTYERYFMIQVAKGYLNINRIEEDAARINKTIEGFIKFARKATWTGSKNIYDYDSWRKLEQTVVEVEEQTPEYIKENESQILFTKRYENDVLAMLLADEGEQPEVFQLWFRKILTGQAACKYGKGTTWCTTDPETATGYIQDEGLYIIELATPTEPRRPILQISGDQFMNAEDYAITMLGARLRNFLGEVVQVAAKQIHTGTLGTLKEYAGRVPQHYRKGVR